MGYVHNTQMAQFIAPNLFHRVTGTWSMAAGQVADTIVLKVNEADQTSTVNIPIIIPSNSVALAGCYLKSVEIDFEIVDTALTAMAAVFNKVTRGADGSVAVVAAQDFSYDAGHDTAGERVDVDQHKMTLTLDTPVWVDNDVYFLIELTIDQALAGGYIEFLGAIANFTLRL